MMLLEPDFERTLRSYALGALEDDPRLQLEEQLVKDPDAFEALGVIEDELTEEYLDGTLTEAERLGFERHHLSSPDRARVPGFVAALRARASAFSVEPPVARRWDPARWLRPALQQPAWLAAAAAILVVSLVANAWLVSRASSLAGQLARTRADRPIPEIAHPSPAPTPGSPALQLAELTAVNRGLEAQFEAERQRRVEAETLFKELERAARRPKTSVPTFALAAGLLRSEGSLARVVVPPGTAVVRLVLDLPGDEYPLYRATLYDVEGEEIWVQSKLKAKETEEQIAVSLVMPTSALPHGDYQMRVSGLTGSGEPERLASYTFRVLTQ